jgi:hypothetical protein
MSEENDTVRVWLVERGYNNRDLIILKYATPDGERLFRRELSAQAIGIDTVTAAKDVPPSDLKAVEDADRRERYAAEVERLTDDHDPNDTL